MLQCWIRPSDVGRRWADHGVCKRREITPNVEDAKEGAFGRYLVAFIYLRRHVFSCRVYAYTRHHSTNLHYRHAPISPNALKPLVLYRACAVACAVHLLIEAIAQGQVVQAGERHCGQVVVKGRSKGHFFKTCREIYSLRDGRTRCTSQCVPKKPPRGPRRDIDE